MIYQLTYNELLTNLSVMKVKIDTREKFHVITILEKELSANMSVNLERYVKPFLDANVKNVIVSLAEVENIENDFAKSLVNLQQEFYENNASFVICCLPKAAEFQLDQDGILEVMNLTPTESEAWDIVQLEEIERELLN